MLDVEKELADAVRHFWLTRATQHKQQGAATGRKDAGSRGAVTGGKHADGFVRLVAAICKNAGLPTAEIHVEKKDERLLPGYFRPSKEWDLVVVSRRQLVAVVEIKSQVGSFGNNFNNRVEEALGNASDFWTAYKKGAFAPSQRPWLGYVFMLEGSPGSLTPTRRKSLVHYAMDEEFQALSYAKRYETVCLRLVRELMYDAACFCVSNAVTGIRGEYQQPSDELSIRNFARSLHARAAAFAAIKA